MYIQFDSLLLGILCEAYDLNRSGQSRPKGSATWCDVACHEVRIETAFCPGVSHSSLPLQRPPVHSVTSRSLGLVDRPHIHTWPSPLSSRVFFCSSFHVLCSRSTEDHISGACCYFVLPFVVLNPMLSSHRCVITFLRLNLRVQLSASGYSELETAPSSAIVYTLGLPSHPSPSFAFFSSPVTVLYCLMFQ